MRYLVALNILALCASLIFTIVVNSRLGHLSDSVDRLLKEQAMQPGDLYHSHYTVVNGVNRLVEVKTKKADYADDAAWIAAHAQRVAEALAQYPPV